MFPTVNGDHARRYGSGGVEAKGDVVTHLRRGERRQRLEAPVSLRVRQRQEQLPRLETVLLDAQTKSAQRQATIRDRRFSERLPFGTPTCVRTEEDVGAGRIGFNRDPVAHLAPQPAQHDVIGNDGFRVRGQRKRVRVSRASMWRITWGNASWRAQSTRSTRCRS